MRQQKGLTVVAANPFLINRYRNIEMTNRNSTSINLSKQPKCKSKYTVGLTTADFISRSIASHGNKYRYDKSVYINFNTKVEIFCVACNDYFWQLAGVHMKGHSCPVCDKKKRGLSCRSKQSDVIARFKKAHGDRYSYDKVEYKTNKLPVVITCCEHGDFSQSVVSHAKGHGCPHCAGCGRKTQDEAIAGFISVHGYRYDYSLVEYKGVDSKVKIICKNHGVFEQIPYDHMKGYNCRYCSIEQHPNLQPMVLDYVIEGFVSVHGEKYDYSKVDYQVSSDKVTIVCSLHGDFRQAPSNHKNGDGCPDCANLRRNTHSRDGYIASCNANNNGDSSLYVVRITGIGEDFYKVGITKGTIKERFRKLKKYKVELLYLVEGRAGYIYDLEIKLHHILTKSRYNPLIKFGGHTECFTTIKPIEKLLKELSTTDQLQLLA